MAAWRSGTLRPGQYRRRVTGVSYRASPFRPTIRRWHPRVTEQTVRLWDVSTGDCVGNLTGHTNGHLCVTFSADGKWLASGGANELIIWNLNTKSLHVCLKETDARFASACFSPDGKYLAAGYVAETDSVLGRADW